MEIVFPFPGQSSWPEPWLVFTQTCWREENCLLRWGSGPVITFYWDIDVAQIKQGWSCGCCRQEKRKRAKYDVFLHLQPIGMCFAGLMVIWTLNSHSFPFLSPMTRNNSSGLSVTPNPLVLCNVTPPGLLKLLCNGVRSQTSSVHTAWAILPAWWLATVKTLKNSCRITAIILNSRNPDVQVTFHKQRIHWCAKVFHWCLWVQWLLWLQFGKSSLYLSYVLCKHIWKH